MSEHNLDILLDKYALGILDEEGLKELEVQALLDENLKSEMQASRDIAKAFEFLGNNELRLLLDKIVDQDNSGSDKLRANRLGWKRMLIIVLTGLAFLMGFVIIKNVTSRVNASPDKLFAEYFKDFETSSETRGQNQDEIRLDFIAAYNKKNYRGAMDIYKGVVNSEDNEMRLLFAVSAINEQQFSEAIRELDKIIEDEDYFFKDHAIWYKALVKLNQNSIHEAKSLLQLLAGDQGADHHEDSKKLLNTI